MGKNITKDLRPKGRQVKQIKPKSLKKAAVAFSIVIMAAILYTVYLAPHTLEARQREQLESTQHQLIEERNARSVEKVQTEEQKKQLEEIQKKLDETTKQLQAKREANTAVASVPTQVSAPKPIQTPSVAPSGTCADWIRAAGITDVANAMELIRRESGCNPNAINPTSGACGVAQELPCGKSGCSLGDGACQVKWMYKYVVDRYGSFSGAVAFHNTMHWY